MSASWHVKDLSTQIQESRRPSKTSLTRSATRDAWGVLRAVTGTEVQHHGKPRLSRWQTQWPWGPWGATATEEVCVQRTCLPGACGFERSREECVAGRPDRGSESWRVFFTQTVKRPAEKPGLQEGAQSSRGETETHASVGHTEGRGPTLGRRCPSLRESPRVRARRPSWHGGQEK